MAQGDSNDNVKSDSYEFDAPSHVIDFKALDNADNADHWFEYQASENNGHLTTPLRNDKPLGGTLKANLPRAIVSPCVKGDPAPTTSSSPPSNLVTSWDNRGPTKMPAKPKRKTTAQPTAQPRRVSKRKTTNEEPTTVQLTPPVKKCRRSSTTRPARRSNGGVRRSGQKARAAAATTSSTQHKSSEEQEMERIRALQKQVAEHRKQNEASYKAAMAGGPPPKKLALSTTVPKEFNFSTDSRVKAGAASDTAYKEMDFISQLRQHTSPAKAPKGSTVPKPFNLSTGNKRKVEEPAAYVSIAQQIDQFQRRTPDRYHLRSRQSQERGPSPVKGEHLKITQPHTPQLMTRQRSRPTTIKSSAELEADELDKIHKFKFKALELNRKILESALNPKKPVAKESTKTEAFQLQIEKRLQERQATKKPEEAEKQHTFHSQPIPTKILEGVVGVPEKKILHPTVPESPAFALKKRVRLDRKVEEVKPPSPIKAHPMPHFGLPFQPRLQEKTQVEVCPFSFEERELERRALKEKRLEEMRNEEVPKFKAQPLPDFQEVVGLPEKKVVEPTKPEPFKLLIDQRGAVKNDRWEQMMKEEQKRQTEAVSFKAGPNTVIHKEPFHPKKENRAVPEGINHSVVPEAFQLMTERRAKDRQEYEKAVSETQALRARMQEEQQQKQERDEEEEIIRLRHDQVHRAQPVRRYKSVEVKKSDLALTVPQSPNFSKRFHL